MKQTLRSYLMAFIAFTTTIAAYGQQKWHHGRLQVTPDGHYLQYEDGTPFFWLGDTAWELFHRLKKEEIMRYLDNRKAKGFNVIQAVVLAEMDGLRQPNQYGDIPLIDLDPEKPNEAYFKLVDDVITAAYERQLFMGLLPTWGDKVTRMWGTGPAVFTTENAYHYGHWLGNRYKDNQNIVWILGGDRPALHDSVDTRPIWRAMAKGILEATKGKALLSYHISGGEHSTSQQIHTEPWLHMNMMQSGHGSGHDVPVWEWVTRDRALIPTKPTLDSEPNYEDHPVNPWPKWDPKNGYFNDYDIRKQSYRSVFAGACGVTYGHHSIWQFWSEREEKINHADRYWSEALNRPGAFQVGYLRQLIESRPFIDRIPDQTIIADGQGEKGQHIRAFRDREGSYFMAYIPEGRTIEVDLSTLKAGPVRVWWFNPATAETTDLGILNHAGRLQLTSPTQGFGKDWVLVIDHVAKRYPIPTFKHP
ncbi:glycoside hydrolase family 140 protein [Parapedobacter pyrenivorans]|nr:glycoside hydrolase family 140 protein [Parapedobacter pyrenivorans]